MTKFKYVNDVWFVKSLVNVSFIVSWIRKNVMLKEDIGLVVVVEIESSLINN